MAADRRRGRRGLIVLAVADRRWHLRTDRLLADDGDEARPVASSIPARRRPGDPAPATPRRHDTAPGVRTIRRGTRRELRAQSQPATAVPPRPCLPGTTAAPGSDDQTAGGPAATAGRQRPRCRHGDPAPDAGLTRRPLRPRTPMPTSPPRRRRRSMTPDAGGPPLIGPPDGAPRPMVIPAGSTCRPPTPWCPPTTSAPGQLPDARQRT